MEFCQQSLLFSRGPSDRECNPARWAETHCVQVLQAGDQRRPSVRRLAWRGQSYILKDYFHHNKARRATLGRLVIANEARAYRRLSGMAGVPSLCLQPSPDSLLIEYVAGTPLHKVAPGQLPFAAIEQAEQLLAGMHDRGVVHGDLGHDSHGDYGRDTNLIWGHDQRLYVVDFASAMFADGWSLGFYETFRRHDCLLVPKLLRRFFPEHPCADGVSQLPATSRRWLRWLKKV